MSLVSEAIARYHKLIESEPYIDLAWAHALQERIQREKLDGRPISPVLRPHFITKRDYVTMSKAAETLLSAIARMEKMAMASPELLAKMQLLPAERMLAAVEPGYSTPSVTALLDTALTEKSLHFIGHSADIPAGVLGGDALANLYYEAPPVKAFRRKHKLTKLNGVKPLLTSILKAYKEFGGRKKPNIAIVEMKQPFQSAVSEHALLAAYLEGEGYPTRVLTPDQIEYRGEGLAAGDFTIDIVVRRVRLQDFLVRYDLNHPLMRAYKAGAVCMVNSFRADVGSKRSLFALLSDTKLTEKFPAAERKVLKDHVPWTRVVETTKTTYKSQTVDLPDFVLKHRTKLVIKPNEDAPNNGHGVRGADVNDAAWEKALRQAMRTPSVVQEAFEPSHAVFPMLQYGSLMMKDMVTHLHPHAFGGVVHGASCWLGLAGAGGFSTLTGLAPTFMLEGK